MSVLSLRRRPAPDPLEEVDRVAAAEALARHAAAVARAGAERAEIELEARIARERRLREAAAEDREWAARARESARLARRARRGSRAVWLRAVAPLVLVNGTAMYGQVAAGYKHLTGVDTAPGVKLAVALLVASAAEVIALYVQWHAHDALLRGDTRTAARLRRVSYGIALVIGLVNASHFLGQVWAAVVFGLMSASSPWLWGLHTRRARNVQLVADGRADVGGVVFSGERRRTFPILTWKAHRFALRRNITDPQIAWEAFLAEREKDDACRCRERALPGVPTETERDAMTAEQVRDRARRTYLEAVAVGVEVDDKVLARAYGMQPRWGRARIAEAKRDRTE